MNNKALLYTGIVHLLILFCMLDTADVYAQNASQWLQGTVKDQETGSTLGGVSIRYKGTLLGATEEDGTFRVQIGETDTLTFFYVGYKQKQVRPNGKDNWQVFMQRDPTSIEEVQVSANVNDVDFRYPTSAITVVKGKDISFQPVADPLSLLQGKVPGLQVIRSGELGVAPEVRLRGTSSLTKGNVANQPLYVLDGQVIDMDAFLTLNPQDIEEMKVLKDATANAMYGIKAANGVIEITSKRAKNGEKSYFYNFQQGITMRGNRGLPMMDSNEKLEYERLAKASGMPGYANSEEYIRSIYGNDPNVDSYVAEGKRVLDSLRGINTDWFNELVRRDYYQSHQVGMSSGSEKTSFYLSLNYTKQGGKIEGNNLERYTGRYNMQHRAHEKLTIDLSVGAGYSETTTENESSFNPTELVYRLNPYETPSDALGRPTRLWSYPNNTFSTLRGQANGYTRNTRGSATGTLRYKPLPELSVDVSQGLDYVLNDGYLRIPPEAFSQNNLGEEKGNLRMSKASNINYSSNARLLWQKRWDKHDITLTANMDYLRRRYQNVGYKGYGLLSKIKTGAGINQGLLNFPPELLTGQQTDAQLGFGGAAGYTFDEWLNVFVNYKRDGASVLPVDKRWNVAWATGLGVELSEIDYLKAYLPEQARLRFSVGNTAGLGAVSPAMTVATFIGSQATYAQGRAMSLESLYNPDLVPEQSRSYNVGLDLGFFSGRLSFTADVYRRTNKQVLLLAPIQPSHGFESLMSNVGVIRNQGIEFSLSGTIVQSADWRWQMGVNGSYNQNKVLDLYGRDRFSTDPSSTIPEYIVGESTDILWGVKNLGINPLDGMPYYQGATGREIIGDWGQVLLFEDYINLGLTTPKISGGISNTVSYRDFSFGLDLYYALGTTKNIVYTGDVRYNNYAGMVDRTWWAWGQDGKEVVNPNFEESRLVNSNVTTTPNDRTIQKADYLRLSNVRLGYQVPKRLIEHWPVVRGLNCLLQAQDLFVITNFDGPDPESGNLVGSLQPVVSFSLNLQF